MLADLAGWKQRPSYLTTIAYELCSVILENYSSLADGKLVLFLSLQIGFRHLDPQHPRIPTELVHAEHQRLINAVFESGDEEVIADLLHAWTCHSDSHQPPPSLDACAGDLIGLRPSSRRVRRLVIRSIELIGHRRFKEFETGELCRSLDHLHVGVEDMDRDDRWINLLTSIIRCPEGVRCLPHPYWELLMECSLSGSLRPGCVTRDPDIMTDIMMNLENNQEWGKLECWMSIVWILWPPEPGATTEADIGRVSLSLFRRRPGSVWNLGRRLVERWSEERPEGVPESFRRISDQACLEWRSRLDCKFPFMVVNRFPAYAGACFVLDPLWLPTGKLKTLHVHHHRPHRHLGRILSRRRYVYKP